MKRIILLALLLMILLSSFLAVAGKQQCQKYRQKLDNIQAQQRQANSLNRSNSLANREAKARKFWWQCETGKLKSVSKKKKKKNKKFKINPIKRHHTNRVEQINFQTKKVNAALVPFTSHEAKDQLGLYEGEKLQAWLLYYQPDRKCLRPRSMQQFAVCAEDKQVQQKAFEKDY